MKYALIPIVLIFLVSFVKLGARQVLRVLRLWIIMAAIAGAALLIGTIAGLLIAALNDAQSPWPLPGGVLIGLGAAMCLWQRYKATAPAAEIAIEAPKSVAPVAVAPVDLTPLDHAWTKAARLSSPPIIATARAQCDAVLAAADADPLDMALLDWELFVRDRVPALIAAVDQVSGTATSDDRRALHDELVRDLTAIGNEAEARMDVHRRKAADALMTLRRHLALRLEMGGPA